MTTGAVDLTAGIGTHVATNTISEDAETKHLQRTVLNDSSGTELTKFPTKAGASDFADGALVTLGAKADAKSTATDTTAITLMQVSKQISASIQSLAAIISGGKLLVDVAALSGGNANGQAAPANSAPVVGAKQTYVAAAASGTTTLQVSTGATGDYLEGVIVFPGTTAAGSVVIKDNATTIGTYAGGGTTALLTLTPFYIPVGAASTSGAWKLTLGANVTALAVGNFS